MPETLTHMGNMSVLVLVNLVNMNMTPPSWLLRNHGGGKYLESTSTYRNYLYFEVNKWTGIYILLFIYIFRAHILHHGRTQLWANWADSAERAAAWTSGYPSSTCLNDELWPATKMCPEMNFICTQREAWTPMDTDYHPKIKFQSTADLGGKKIPGRKEGEKTLLSVWDDVFKGWGGGKSRGWIFTGLFGVASVSLGNQDETARFLYHHTVEMSCFFFSSSFLSLNVTLAGHSTDGYYHVFVW